LIKLAITFVGNALVILLLAVLSVLIYHAIVTRRLAVIARELRAVSADDLRRLPLSPMQAPPAQPDELDELAAAIAALRETGHEAIRQSDREQALQRKLMDSLPDLVWLKDAEGVFRACNPLFEKLYGHKEAEIIGKTDFDFVEPDLAHFFRIKDKAAIDANRPTTNEEWLTFADGGYRGLFETTKTPVYDSKGELIGVLGIAHDITERNRSADALRESEQHFRTLANSGSMFIWTSGTDQVCDYFNEPWLEFTGRTLAEELNDGWLDGMHPDDAAHRLSVYRSAFANQTPFSVEYRLRRSDGAYRWVSDHGTPRYSSLGKFIGYIGYCYDVTEIGRAHV
jgi:PAS domain S-box-containing protein